LAGPSVLTFPQKASARIETCCHAAKAREEIGEYEEACELLAPFWSGPGTRPDVNSLPDHVAGELLTRAGSLTAWLGSKKQIEGWQERAKDLLSEAAARFESARDLAGWGRAQKSLALCYWREGSLPEARAIATAALERLGPSKNELWICLQLILAIVEINDGRNAEALARLRKMAAPVTHTPGDLLKGHYYTALENALENLGAIDAAIIEITAAIHHFEQAGYTIGRILAINNLANLYRKARNFSAAHLELHRAERLARSVSDELHRGHLSDSRALCYLEEENFAEAEAAARRSVEIFEAGDEHALLCRSLVTHARTLARLKDQSALTVYVRAYTLAGDRLGSRQASEIALEMISELAGEVCLSGHATLDHARLTFEASVIRAALQETGGNVTAAGVRLGESQQAMSFILKTRHQELRPASNRRPRHRSMIVKK
jgi:tetratricopeptide (TPR) repeat protein